MTKKAKGRLTRRRRFQWIIDDPLAPFPRTVQERDEIRAAHVLCDPLPFEIATAQALAESLYTPDVAWLFNGMATAAPVLQEHLAFVASQQQYWRYDAVPRLFLDVDWPRGPHFPRVDPETEARARERARGLLKSLLTPAQWAEFDRCGTVSEQINGREFVLRPGGMIEVRAPRLTRELWCVAPDDREEWLPPEDKLIGQLLHLRAGPDELCRAANVFPEGLMR